ncbi:hypothetical protein EGI22_15970 [Lacihabitans sp. LS3-19]|uniref:hypothetical protein n=1 Tax=Lacihabitans sp. LS3-19 TaxID=2487335 RepID=UPI0020CB99A9|nr:hypothetical protein [Lacihabitans sp. LS3-19]MCP9769402.1 hypothetical protein [Lacihabitans sp. LS3-19]
MRKIFLLVLILQACSYSKPLEIEGFENQSFKNDRGGCEGKRMPALKILKQNRDIILTISENEILKTFGRYDYQMLDKKNEKFFVYFFEKGPQCENIRNQTTAEAMILHFNSIGLVKEVVFQKGGAGAM